MSAPISDEELTNWAREHLVYEARMLAYAAIRLANRADAPRDPESNVLLESFAIHVRCLTDFIWGERAHQRMDAFASDFCAPGVWERERGELPRPLAEIEARNRAGREVVHLTYHRLDIPPTTKDWPVGEILSEVVDALDGFAIYALPERLDDQTRTALHDLSTHSSDVGPASVATGAHYAYTGGTIPFPNFVGS